MYSDCCPVCSSPGKYFFDDTPSGRSFLQCPECLLVYQEWSTLPGLEDEKHRYELHQNSRDEGYEKWLRSFLEGAFLPWYKGGAVLDFGSGPNPVLSDILNEKGIPVTSYDPFFAPLWPEGKTFSMILLCEVLEHIYKPLSVFSSLNSLAEDEAYLSLKTQFLPSSDLIHFKNWWYREDLTHVRFYTPLSLKILGELSGWDLITSDNSSLAVYKKRLPK